MKINFCLLEKLQIIVEKLNQVGKLFNIEFEIAHLLFLKNITK